MLNLLLNLALAIVFGARPEDRLEAENAKLRARVADLERIASRGPLSPLADELQGMRLLN